MATEQEAIVAKVSDFRDGDMREVTIGETTVLLARVKGAFYAVGSTCTHYGAPLVKGALHGERLICPWHHACFKLGDGSVQEPPALDHLPSYSVRVEGDSVLVAVPLKAADRVEPDFETAKASDTRHFVVVGGGAAGLNAVETLRKSGFTGNITMLSAAAEPPIDRPSLSKEYLDGEVGDDALPLRDKQFYQNHGVELRNGVAVTAIDLDSRTLTLGSGESITADAILLAPGSTPIALDVPGADLPQVFTLRQAGDTEKILETLKTAKRAVIVGGSFIGMETAASLRKQKLDVTVVMKEDVPFAKVFGDEIGKMFITLHQEQGVMFKVGHTIQSIDGNGKVEGVTLGDGTQIKADLVVVGVGVQPATRLIEGLPLQKDGSVLVDRSLKLADGVYAAGDVATFPEGTLGVTARIEHWRLAEQHGRHAALSMLGQEKPFASVPFFWTKQYDLSLRYVGHAKNWDDSIIWGDVAKQKFVAFYVQNGRVAAAAGVGRDQELAAIEELMRVGELPAVHVLREGKIDLAGMLR